MIASKTTLELPEDLFRSAKARAALEGIRLTDLITEAVRVAVESPARGGKKVRFPLISGGPGTPVVTNEMVKDTLAGFEAEEDARIGASVRR